MRPMRIAALAGLGCLIPALAWANPPGGGLDLTSDVWALFDPTGRGQFNDVSATWLRSAFGDPLSDSGTRRTLMGHALERFNIAVLAIASLVLAYKIIAGVAQTAHEGSVLGRRWSTLWGPIRLIAGAGALVPLPSGYCIAQIIVLVAAQAGIGLANHMWATTVRGLTTFGSPIAPPNAADFEQTGRSVFKISLCMAAVNALLQQRSEGGNTSGPAPGSVQRLPEPSRSRNGRFGLGDTVLSRTLSEHTYFYGGTDSSGLISRDACGTLTTIGAVDSAGFQEVTRGAGNFFSASEYYTVFGNNDFDAMRMRMIQNATGVTHGPALDQLFSAFAPMTANIARSFLANQYQELTLNGAAISAAINAYAQTVSTSSGSTIAQSAPQMSETFNRAATAGGWVNAGAWWMQLANFNSAISSVATFQPSFSQPKWQELSNRLAEPKILTINGFGDELWTKALYQGTWDGHNGQVARAMDFTQRGDGRAADNSSALGVIFRAIWDTFMGGLGTISDAMDLETRFDLTDDALSFGSIGDNEEERSNPLAALAQMGRSMFNTAVMLTLTAYMGDKLSDNANNMFDSIPLVGSFFSAAAATVGDFAAVAFGVVLAIGKMMLIPGIILGYILPMLPYVLWIGAVMGWFILVFEGVIAAPLWAFAHIRFDGEGFAGPAGEKGYYLILSMLLRPALMVLGMNTGLIVFSVMTPFVHSSFNLALYTTGGAGPLAVVTNLMSIFMVSALYLWLAYKSFSMIHVIPDRILRWINMGGEGLDEDSAVRDTRVVAVAGMTQAAGLIGGAGRAAGNAALKAPPGPAGLLKQGKQGGGAQGGGGGGGDQRSTESATRVRGGMRGRG